MKQGDYVCLNVQELYGVVDGSFLSVADKARTKEQISDIQHKVFQIKHRSNVSQRLYTLNSPNILYFANNFKERELILITTDQEKVE